MPDITQDPPISDPPQDGLEPSTLPAIPPTPTPPVPPTNDPKYVGLLEGTVREQNRKIAELERAQAISVAEPPKPVKTPDEARTEYFNNPEEATRKLIREELASTTAELTQFVRELKGQSKVDKLIETAKLNPKFKAHWSPGVEQYVRERAGQADPKLLNDDSFTFLVVSAIGMKSVGALDDGQPAPSDPPTPAPTNVPVPPYIAPSAPPAPAARRDAPKFKPLNEDERRLLREFNSGKPEAKKMTEQEYREWQEMPDSEVVHSKLGIPKPVVK